MLYVPVLQLLLEKWIEKYQMVAALTHANHKKVPYLKRKYCNKEMSRIMYINNFINWLRIHSHWQNIIFIWIVCWKQEALVIFSPGQLFIELVQMNLLELFFRIWKPYWNQLNNNIWNLPKDQLRLITGWTAPWKIFKICLLFIQLTK